MKATNKDLEGGAKIINLCGRRSVHFKSAYLRNMFWLFQGHQLTVVNVFLL